MVGVEGFLELDIRVGRIVEVRQHEQARKPMYVLKVDLGAEIGMRSIVAGIRGHYTEEQLLGREVVCIANLDPKMIAGVESQGMLLACEDKEGIALLMPDRKLEPGSRIR